MGGLPPSGKGYRYKDREAEADGVLRLRLKAGSARSKLLLKGKNNSKKGMTALPTGITAALEGETSAAIEWLTHDAQCFRVELNDVRKNTSTLFQARP